jgi:hypothetical protein
MVSMENKKLTLDDVLNFVSTAGQEDLVAVSRHAHDRHEAIVKRLKRNLGNGDKVQWKNKYGVLARGTVTYVRGKTAHVTTDLGAPYRVSVILLSHQE